jgi:ADP-ribose pyrophosphatase
VKSPDIPPAPDSVEILARDTAYRGYVTVDRYRIRHGLYRGGMSGEISREVVERGRAVGVLLYDPAADAVVLIEQFRLPAKLAGFSGWEIEIVAGMADEDDASDADVARREASEEAGLAVKGEFIPIHRYLTTPGIATETIALFCGRVDSSGAGGIFGLEQEHEDIKVLVLPYRAAMALLRRDRISNGPTVVALYWLAANRTRLRRLWR